MSLDSNPCDPLKDSAPSFNSGETNKSEFRPADFGFGSVVNAPESVESTEPPSPLPCRRCGKMVAAELLRCPYCDARMQHATADFSEPSGSKTNLAGARADAVESESAISLLMIFYLILLATNLIGHWCVRAMLNDNLSEERRADIYLEFTICIEAFDSAILLIALAKIPKPPLVGPKTRWGRTTGFIAAPFFLALALALNFGYHALLRNYVQFPAWVRGQKDLPIYWAILLVCAQPAIVEELFFRYLTLGTLTRVMGVGTAVFVSSIMFGMAHSGVMLSIPILTVCGFCLGVVRIWSGSLILPMLLHALHNAAVVYLEWVK